MLKLRTLIPFFMTFFLFGCVDPNAVYSYDQYMGLWERPNQKVMQISKKNGFITMTDNVLEYDISKVDGTKRFVESKDKILTEASGILIVSSLLGNLKLSLSEDNNTLKIHQSSFQRIDTARLDALNLELKNAIDADEKLSK